MPEIMQLHFESEKDVTLVLEPWGQVAQVRKGEKVLIEYRDLDDGHGGSHWPRVDLLKDGSIMIDIPSIDLRALKDGEIFFECWE